MARSTRQRSIAPSGSSVSSIISVVSAQLRRMLDEQQEPLSPEGGALRCVLLGGGPAPRPLLEECARRDIPVVQSYGLTETASQAATLSPADALRKLGSAGRPLLPTELRIAPEAGTGTVGAEAGGRGIWCGGNRHGGLYRGHA